MPRSGPPHDNPDTTRRHFLALIEESLGMFKDTESVA